MRGKENGMSFPASNVGITPAYAGKRGGQIVQQRRILDHPRVCGEKRLPCRNISARKGSPPRMRGKASGPCCRYSRSRITPAYAGKSECCRACEEFSWDHPRVCGEKRDMVLRRRQCWGSPPRMRGKDCPAFTARKATGITPAYAGKSRYFSPFSFLAQDHPRVCGEKPMKVFSSFSITGSPPRMRGKATASPMI